MRSRSMLPLLGLLAFATACDDTTHLGDAFGPNAHSSGAVVLEQSQYMGQPGDTARIRAFVLDVKGRRFTVEDLNWNSADSSIAVVNDGRLYLVQSGETQLSVDYNGTRLTASARASNAAKLSKVDIYPEGLSLAVAEEEQLGLYMRYSDGRTIENHLGVTWTSSDATVAAVSGTGMVTAIKTGKSRIIGKRGKQADTVTVTVVASAEKKPAPTLSIAPDTGLVEVGQAFRFSTALSTGEKSPDGVTWTVSDPTIASVSTSGELIGKKEGRATVQAVYGGKGVKAVLRVMPASQPPVEEQDEDSGDASQPPESPEAPASSPPPATSNVAELPRIFLDTRMPQSSGKTIRVPANGNLQAALDDAQPGDRVLLAPGATYTGNFRLRPKSGNGWIVVQTDTPLPAEGVRMTPTLAANARLAKLVSNGNNAAALQTDSKASGWRIIGVEITVKSTEANLNTLVRLGAGTSSEQSSLDAVPSRIVLDRVYVHGTPTIQLIRCIQLQSASTAIIDSWVSDCHAKGFDSQAIVGWNGPGPFKIVNNYLEGAGENVMFGGANPAIAGLVPSDVEFRRNHVFKPASWEGRWTVKNLFELKMGRRILIESNVFENIWIDAQRGNAFVLKSDNGQTADITIRYNVIRNAAQGAIALASAVNETADPMRNVDISNNLMYKLGAESDFSSGHGLGISVLGRSTSSINNLLIRHNTILAPHGPLALHSDGSPPLGSNLVFSGNVANHGSYGVHGSGGTGLTTVKNRYSTFSIENNVFFAGNRFTSSAYPSSNLYYATVRDIGFVGPENGDFRFSTSSAVRTSAAASGVDMDGLLSAIRGVVDQ